MRAALAFCLATVALGASACAVVEGLGNLERVDAPPSSDGGAGSPEGGAPTGDGGSDVRDAGPAIDTGASSTCSGPTVNYRFCEDFDSRDLPGQWNSFHQTGGTLTVDTAASTSPPRSLLEVASPLTVGVYDVSLHSDPLDLPAFSATLRFEFEVQPVSVDSTPNAALIVASLDFTNATQDRYSLVFTLFPSNGVLTLSLGEQSGLADGGTSYVPHTLPDALPLGQWTHVTLQVVYTDSATATAQVSFGSTTELAAQTLHPTAPDVTKMIVGIGTTYGTVPSSGWSIRYDDVTLRSL